mmetsp:Transcript_17340/g.47826  ORF Transcript_17340/g.47826 Transcript_17340/m.47826 type:complete len:205 (+) Transcript_17340:613-1227(+)
MVCCACFPPLEVVAYSIHGCVAVECQSILQLVPLDKARVPNCQHLLTQKLGRILHHRTNATTDIVSLCFQIGTGVGKQVSNVSRPPSKIVSNIVHGRLTQPLNILHRVVKLCCLGSQSLLHVYHCCRARFLKGIIDLLQTSFRFDRIVRCECLQPFIRLDCVLLDPIHICPGGCLEFRSLPKKCIFASGKELRGMFLQSTAVPD